MISEFQFGPWLPENPDYKNPGLEVVKNAIPSPSGYQPAYGLTASGTTGITGTVLGADSFDRRDGTPVIVVGTTGDLYSLVGGAETSVTYITWGGKYISWGSTTTGPKIVWGPPVFDSSLGLSLSSTDSTIFERFGDAIYGTSKNGDTWYIPDMEAGTDFSVVPGNIPSANAMARVSDFLVMGDLTDIDASDQPYRVRWSPFNNPTGTWGTDIATQADYQDLDFDLGPVTAISGGTYGFVFQKRGIWRMTYVGGSSVFRFDLFEKNRGCVAPRSVVRVGDVAYFLHFDGFFRTDGSSVENISRGRMWDWFKARMNQAYISTVIGSVDFERRCVVWSYPAGETTAFTEQIWFNWETDQWGYVEQTTDFILSSTRGGKTLEEVALIYPDLDAMDVSLDDPVFKPSGRALVAFVNGVLSEFNGATLEAMFGSGSLQPHMGQRSFVRGVAPLIANNDGGTEVSIGYRDTMTKGYSSSTSTAIGALGYTPTNVDGRYFRVFVTIPAGEQWTDCYGFQIDHSAAGMT